jgi:integral membrane protein
MLLADLIEQHNQLRRLRVVSCVEGATLLLLLGVAVPLKHLAGFPIATAVMGPVHGIAFVLYLWMVTQTAASGGWTRRETACTVFAAFIPFGTLVNERALARRQTSLPKSI